MTMTSEITDLSALNGYLMGHPQNCPDLTHKDFFISAYYKKLQRQYFLEYLIQFYTPVLYYVS